MSPASTATDKKTATEGADQKPTLMLLDGNSLAFRAFYALPAENFKTQGGLTTNAVYGFTAMLINLLRDEQPSHIAAAFDVSRQTFRLEKYPEYKAGRSATPDEFRGQIDITKEVLGALGITVLAEPGFEADDVIATLATQAEDAGYRVLVVTGDRDSLQLVSDDVTVLYPRKGVSELTRFTPEAVVEKYGLTPQQYPDFAALRGDPSDNLPGIPGVGEKTATKWIAEYGSLQALVDGVDTVKGKVGDALRANLSHVVLNRELTDLVKDVPLAQTPDTLRMQPWDRDHIHRLFDDLEFRVLRDRLFDTLASADPEVDQGFDVRGGALESGELAAWLAEHSSGSRFGLAVVGTHLAFDADATALAIVAADGDGRYIDTATLHPDDEAALASWLADVGQPKALHEAKLAMHDLEGRGWKLAGVTSDTALAAYLVRPGQRSFALDDLSLRYLKRELRADNPEQQQLSLLDDSDGVDDQAVQTVILRASAVMDLADALDEELARIDSSSLLGNMELPVQRALAEMETAGIAVDLGLLSELQSEFAGQIRDAAEAAYAVIGKQINLGSPKQLQVVLFDELEMPKTKRTKTGYTTDADALQGLFDKTGHPFLQHLLTHRDATRLKVTVDGLLNSVASDGRDPHDVQPDDRRHRPAVVDRAEPAEHPDSHRGGPPDPRRIRCRQGLRRADDGRLQPDRDADHGASVCGRGPHRGVQHRRGPALVRRVAGVFRADRGGHGGAAATGEGDVVRVGVRAVRLWPCRAAEDLHRGSQGADGAVLLAVRRGARLPARGGRPGPQGRLHVDGARPAPLPARAGQQQPQRPGGRRAGRAQCADPGQRRRHHQGGDDQRRPGAEGSRAEVSDAAAGARRAAVRGRSG